MPYEIRKDGDRYCVHNQETGDKVPGGCHPTHALALGHMRALYVNVPDARTKAAEDKKPYGDVSYADPGYQPDGKKRYPIDTAEHVRAAWSYINQAGNAARYSAKQREAVKARIRAAAKRLGIEIEREAAAETARLIAAYSRYPGHEGSTGPFPAEYNAPHVYARDVHSGSGNCVCGRGKEDSLHVEIAPGVPNPETAAEGHKGVMIALYPDPAVAGRLALDVEGAEPADALHVTLAYLPDELDEDRLATLKTLVRQYAAARPALAGSISGKGEFNAGPGSDQPVVYVSVDVPSLPAFRQGLVELLQDNGFMVSMMHGFTPHMTLLYGEADIPRPSVDLEFDQLTVANNDERFDFPFARAEAARLEVRDVVSPTPAHLYDMTSAQIDLPETRAFLTEVAGRTMLTGPALITHDLLEKAKTPNRHFLWLHGRYVGSEAANRNGAFWSTKDLEVGEPTVRYGPLNWLHESRRVIGTIADARLIQPTGETAAEGGPSRIDTASVIWRYLYPDEATVVETASEARRLWFSMECVSRTVACVGINGCGNEVPYMDYIQGRSCAHMRERSSVRRFVEPTFLGGAVIVPPVHPGWAEAHAEVMREAASLAEESFEAAGRPDVEASLWELLMAQVVDYASA